MSFLFTQLFHLKKSSQNYSVIFSKLFPLETLLIQVLDNCKIIPACSWPRLHNCCGEWEDWDPVNWFNHTSWVAIVTPTDRPKSVRNRCVIEVFGGVCVLSRCFLGFCGCRGLCHRTARSLPFYVKH